MKRPYLAVDDYGMGGIWLCVDARSPAEITHAYPELEVFEEPPTFLDETELDRIKANRLYDIDAPPTGYLAEIDKDRDSTKNRDSAAD